MIGLLCRTPLKESRHELLRRVAAGGGAFESKNGTKVHIPGANLNDIANQADDLLEVITRCSYMPLSFLLLLKYLVSFECIKFKFSYSVIVTFSYHIFLKSIAKLLLS